MEIDGSMQHVTADPDACTRLLFDTRAQAVNMHTEQKACY